MQMTGLGSRMVDARAVPPDARLPNSDPPCLAFPRGKLRATP